jgi:hypothetical protein
MHLSPDQPKASTSRSSVGLTPTQTPALRKSLRLRWHFEIENGGHLVIGLEDGTLVPNLGGEPAEVRDAFQLDKIQGLVSRYACELFEVGVGFSERDGIEYPVIVCSGTQF